MYDQAPSSNTATEAAMLAGKVRDASVLQRALNEHGEQLDKLASLVSTLANRLEPVRVDSPQAEGNETTMAEPSTSMIVGQVNSQTRNVRYLQTALSALLNELEV